MASIKAMAAIALTLIIAVPILMGYGLASTSETVTAWEVDSTSNVTSSLYNNQTDYAAEFMNPYNNRELLTLNDSTWGLVAPDYISVGSTYTSLPNFITAIGTIPLSEPTTTPLSGGNIGTNATNDTRITSPMVYVGAREQAVDNPPLGAGSTLYLEGYRQFNVYRFYMLVDGDSTWSYVSEYGSSLSDLSAWGYSVISAWRANVTTREYTEIAPDVDSDISFKTSDLCSVKIVTSSGTTYLGITEATRILKTASGTVTLGETVYENVTGLFIAEQPSVSSITYSYTVADANGYADPATGWRSFASEELPTWWMNGQENEYVRMMIYIASDASVTLGPTVDSTETGLLTLSYSSSNGMSVTNTATSETTNLGAYNYVMVEMSLTEAKVYGLTSWPTIGVFPDTFNTATVDYADLVSAFRYVYIDPSGAENIRYRVDSVQIVAGSYPTTYQLNFDPAALYPDKSFIFTFKSVAVYGDKIGLNDVPGTSLSVYWDVVDGGITVDGETLSVRGLQVKVVDDGNGGWDAYLDDIKVAEGLSAPPKIWFGTEVWSLTASISTLAETTSTQQVWAPGEFAFSKEDFAACGLLVAGACLVGLGMTGSRSGIKMGVLLMICGGAGLIYLTLI